jgi:transketolase
MHILETDLRQAEIHRERRRAAAASGTPERVAIVAALAREIRLTDLGMIERAGLGHIGGDFSVADILATLYGAVLAVDPSRPGDPERDRLVLSKGHAAGALYATLALCGFFPLSALDSFVAPLSPLNGHPSRTKVPGVETSTGRWDTASRSRSGMRSRRSCEARRGGPSWCSATGSCRRAVTGRPR